MALLSGPYLSTSPCSGTMLNSTVMEYGPGSLLSGTRGTISGRSFCETTGSAKIEKC